MDVGFIGLGTMGLPMAKNIIKNNNNLITTNYSLEASQELKSLGAEVLNTPTEVARKSKVVITVLPADKELKEVAIGKHGLKDGFSSGDVFIDMTTATAITLQNIAKEFRTIGVNVIDAPVSGGVSGAIKGDLTIIVGSDKELLEKFDKLLKAMGDNIIHVGEVGQGKVFKMVNQLFGAIHTLAIGEAFAFGINSGADPELLYEVVKKSTGYSKMMDLKLKNYLFKSNFEPGFKLNLMKKDIELVVDSAKKLDSPLFLGNSVLQILIYACNAGYGDKDHSIVADLIAKNSGVELKQ